MLEARNITVNYGTRKAVANVSLSTKSGEVIAIIGPNGAGKSTLLRALNGSVVPAGGEVLLDGNPLRGYARRVIARHIAVVAQEAELRFVGSLVMAGCDRRMLATLLVGLPRPYAYHGSRLYYDWNAKGWRLLPDPRTNPEAAFAEWLEILVEKCDLGSLTGILELTHDALARVQSAAEIPKAQ